MIGWSFFRDTTENIWCEAVLHIMLARFSTLLDKKVTSPFCLCKSTRIQQARLDWVGSPLKFSAIPLACGSVIFTKNVCSRCNVRCRHSTNWKMWYLRWRLWKAVLVWYWKDSCAIRIDLAWKLMREKINFIPFHLRRSEWQIYFSSFAIRKHVNLKLTQH